MELNLNTTPQEDLLIEQCCEWLDLETIDLAMMVAEQAADEIIEPEIAQVRLVEILTEIMVRNRRELTEHPPGEEQI